MDVGWSRSVVVSLAAFGFCFEPCVDQGFTYDRAWPESLACPYHGIGTLSRLPIGTHLHYLARAGLGIWDTGWYCIRFGIAFGCVDICSRLAKASAILALGSLWLLAFGGIGWA